MLKIVTTFFWLLAAFLFAGLMVVPLSVEFGQFNWRFAVALVATASLIIASGGTLFLRFFERVPPEEQKEGGEESPIA